MSNLVTDLFARFAARRHTPPKPTSGGRLVYAIGDVHGRLDLLDRLIRLLADDVLASRPATRPLLVFLGDYVDRGRESKGVIDRIIALSNEVAFELRTLKGNHEQVLISFLGNASVGPSWADRGGLETLASYGVKPPNLRADISDWERTRQEFKRRIPASHLAFLSDLELILTVGDYVFVHAGLRPGRSIQDQDEHDLLWIRDDFLNERRPFEKVVVHGHTPEETPFVGPGRLGIDTGAYATGVLTAIRLNGEERLVIQASAGQLTQGASRLGP